MVGKMFFLVPIQTCLTIAWLSYLLWDEVTWSAILWHQTYWFIKMADRTSFRSKNKSTHIVIAKRTCVNHYILPLKHLFTRIRFIANAF